MRGFTKHGFSYRIARIFYPVIEKIMSNTEHTLDLSENARPHNFITQIIDEDLASGKHQSVHTRFPPEPNG